MCSSGSEKHTVNPIFLTVLYFCDLETYSRILILASKDNIHTTITKLFFTSSYAYILALLSYLQNSQK